MLPGSKPATARTPSENPKLCVPSNSDLGLLDRNPIALLYVALNPVTVKP